MVGRLLILAVATALAAACTVQFVAPYNSDLQQKASSMQAEVAAWDLSMRGGTGTIADDPRYPDVIATLNKWHGEADAMLTLAVSNDPGMINCSEAVKAVCGAIQGSIPADLRAAAQLTAASSNPSASSPSGCEAALVAGIATGIDDIERALKYCRADWVGDAYFAGLRQNRYIAPKPPLAPNTAKQGILNKSCSLCRVQVRIEHPD
jgi:hypothetical protein